jgi:magnesium transporter
MAQDQLLLDVRELLATQERDGILGLADQIGPAEWADVVPNLNRHEIAALIQWLPDEEIPQLLADLNPHQAATILRLLTHADAADMLEAMDPADATDLVEVLPPAVAEQILVEMAPSEADEVRNLLTYPSDTAGGIMTPVFVTVSPELRANQAVAALRRIADGLTHISNVYVIDSQDHLLGVLPLERLVLAHTDQPVEALMVTDPIRVQATTDAFATAKLLLDRNLLAVPVVDADDRMLGVVTVANASDVIEAALSAVYLMQAGTVAEAMEHSIPLQVARLRLPWLFGTMAIELGSGVIISHFNQVLTQVILLASFMPVISAVSGNVGLQAAAIVVRGLDTGHITIRRWGQQVTKELSASLVMALACGAALGVVGAIWSRHLPFGLVIGGAMICSMLTAGFMGAVIPLLSKHFGFDPATTAGPFETAFQDVVGFAVFLWLASLLLPWLH